MADTAERTTPRELDRVIIRFAGDSGDGMQLTGDRFTSASALFGNDLATLPEFPAEIRAPAGTLAGVSAFQVHISDHDITTPGDAPNVLVAMNPAALHAELDKLEPGGTVIINIDTFDERNLTKAGYDTNPLTDGTLKGYNVYEVPMTSLTKEACAPLGVKPRDADRSKNLFALGLISWMYTRPEQPTIDWISEKFAKRPLVRDANLAAFRAGHAFGETAELFDHPYQVHAGPAEAGRLHQHHRQHRPGVGSGRRRSAGPAARLPGLVPHHAGVGHPPRAVQAQELRRAHPAGRGRDRRHRRRPRARPTAATSA